MNIRKYFWELNASALKETEETLRNSTHPKFTFRMITFLSRCQNPKELFKLLSKDEFIDIWPLIKNRWIKIARQSEFRDWWQTIYERLLERRKAKELKPKGEGSVLFKKIGRLIRETRIKKGLSQKMLATVVNMQQPDISKIEKGEKNITLQTLIYISKALNIKKINLT
jgi:DNA-binding XRE family transcriptional regulator